MLKTGDRCSTCGNKIIQHEGDQVRFRIRGVLSFVNGRAMSKCHWCGSDVELPLELKLPTPKLVIPAET
jgi:DNA-directed RNA polymerase subunit RPC12/RpoP